MRRIWLRSAGLLPIATLAACVHLSRPVPRIADYSLSYSPPTISGTPLSVVIGVAPLRVAATYDRELIVYHDGEYAVGTYFYSRWSVNPGNMIADLLARDFAASDLYRAVQRSPGLLPIDYQLTGDVEEIAERIAADRNCSAHLRIRVLLLRAHGGTHPVSLHKTYSGEEPCGCDADALAAAMSRILERVSSGLQRDAHDAIASDRNKAQVTSHK